jgi:hypothetical protein
LQRNIKTMIFSDCLDYKSLYEIKFKKTAIVCHSINSHFFIFVKLKAVRVHQQKPFSSWIFFCILMGLLIRTGSIEGEQFWNIY